MTIIRRIIIGLGMLVLAAAFAITVNILPFEFSNDIEELARTVLYGGIPIMIVLLLWEFVAVAQSWRLPEPEDPPTTIQVIEPKELDDAVQIVNEAEDYSRKAVQRTRVEIDVEDAREEI